MIGLPSPFKIPARQTERQGDFRDLLGNLSLAAARETVQFWYRDPIPYDLIERLVTASLMRHQGQSIAETTSKNGGAGQVNPASDST